MAQFDVFRNPGRRSRGAIPFLVVIQSRLFDSVGGQRLVAPLYRADAIGQALTTQWDKALAPAFIIQGVQLLLNPLRIASVPVNELGDPVASLADDESSSAIIAAIDRAISRAYG